MKKLTLAVTGVILALVVGANYGVYAGGKQAAPAQSATAAQKITVLLPKHEMDTKDFMEGKARQFEKESGIQVELINMAWDNVADRVIAELTAGGSSYDVIEFDNGWVAKFLNNNWVAPLDSYITPEMKSGILPGLLDKFSGKGHLYGIAWNNDTRFFMYNKAKLDAAGIAAPPKTWQELKDQSKTLMSKGLVKYGYTDAYLQGQAGANEILFAVYAHGGDFFDKDLNLTVLTSPGVKDAYNFLYDGLQVSKFIDPASLTASYENAADAFCMGNTAFMLQAWPGVYDQANDATTSKIVGQIAVAPYSLSADGTSQVVLTLPEAMAIPNTSKNKDAAWKYIAYFSSKAFDKEKALAIGALPIWTDNFNDPQLLTQYPYWQQFGQQAQHARGFADIEWFDQFSNVLQIESQKILLGNISVDKGLEEMNTQLLAIPK